MTPTEEIVSQARRRAYHAGKPEAEQRVAELTRAAMASPEVAALRARRDRMAERVAGYRTDRARLEAEADQLAAQIRAAIVEGDEKKADSLEKKLAGVQAEAAKVTGRLPDLEGAHQDLCRETDEGEARAIRLACRAAAVPAVQKAFDASRAIAQAEAEFAAKLATLAESAAHAEVVARELQAAASPGSNFEYGEWQPMKGDRFAAEAAAAGLPAFG